MFVTCNLDNVRKYPKNCAKKVGGDITKWKTTILWTKLLYIVTTPSTYWIRRFCYQTLSTIDREFGYLSELWRTHTYPFKANKTNWRPSLIYFIWGRYKHQRFDQQIQYPRDAVKQRKDVGKQPLLLYSTSMDNVSYKCRFLQRIRSGEKSHLLGAPSEPIFPQHNGLHRYKKTIPLPNNTSCEVL